MACAFGDPGRSFATDADVVEWLCGVLGRDRVADLAGVTNRELIAPVAPRLRQAPGEGKAEAAGRLLHPARPRERQGPGCGRGLVPGGEPPARPGPADPGPSGDRD